MEMNYELDVKGYRLEGSESSLEEQSGVYFVYAANYNKERDTVSLNRLLYIGQAKNIRTRLMQHENEGDLAAYRQPGEILCYSRAFLPEADLDRCEAALIFEHRDMLVNVQSTREFDYDATHVVVKGRNKFLHADFWARRAN